MVVRLTGGLFNDAGTARVAITAYAFAASLNADENTATGSAAGSDATDASGEWDITGLAENLYDVRIDDGSTRRWRRANERVQLENIDTSGLQFRNPADTFTIDIVTPAVTANRTLNLPLLTGAATVAAIDHGIKGADISSVGAALTLVAGSDYANVTGTTTVTSISTRPAGSRFTFKFDDALILTHNATTLILQGAVNLTTAAGDVLTFISDGGGNWREESRRLAAAAAGGTVTSVTGTAPVASTGGATPAISVPAATATVSGLVPTPPNNTTTFLRGDATFAAPASGTVTRAGGNTTEATTTSTTVVDLLSATVTAITAATPFEVMGVGRKTTGAAAAAVLGLKLNTTVVMEQAGNSTALWRTSASNQAEDGPLNVRIGARITNYDWPMAWVLGMARLSSTGAAAQVQDLGAGTATGNTAPPTANITTVVIRAIVNDALVTAAVDDVHVYAYATS